MITLDLHCIIFTRVFLFFTCHINVSLINKDDITESGEKKANFMMMDVLEKHFNENPWYDVTNLSELIKLTGLDESTIKVISKEIILFRHEIIKTSYLTRIIFVCLCVCVCVCVASL